MMSKSIAGFKIFNSESDYQRMVRTLVYFSTAAPLPKFSYFLKRARESGKEFESYYEQCFGESPQLVQWVAYCLMPTHIHIVLKQQKRNGISKMMSNALNSYTRFFNIKHKRSGPLWTGRFKNVRITSDEQLWHLTRYVHLNPVTAYLTRKAEAWPFSSYKQYVRLHDIKYPHCEFSDLLDIKPSRYRKFVEDQIDYQRKLAEIKSLVLE